jgi:hypothetical protein
MSLTVLSACDVLFTTRHGNKKAPLPDDALCRNGAIIFEGADMVSNIVLGVKWLSASRAGQEHPSISLRPSLNHCAPRQGRKARSFRAAPRQGPDADYLNIPEMYLLPVGIMIGQCLQFGFQVFNLLRRRELQDPPIWA